MSDRQRDARIVVGQDDDPKGFMRAQALGPLTVPKHEKGRGQHVIRVGADKPALLAQRLVARLVRDSLVESKPRVVEAFTEALADEIHEDILDATLRR